MMKRILLLIALLVLSSPAYATDWTQEDSCLFAYLYEVSGDPTTDSCGNSNGDYINTPTHATATPPASGDGYEGDSTGYFDLDIADGFDGSDQTVESTDLSGVSWINLDNLAADEAAVITKYQVSSNTLKSFLWRINQDGDVALFTYDGADQEQTDTSTPNVSTAQWEHVAFLLTDNTNIDILINGVEATVYANQNIVSIQNTTTSIAVGRWESVNDELDGDVDETALFNVLLDDTDINNIMEFGLSPAETAGGLKLYDVTVH